MSDTDQQTDWAVQIDFSKIEGLPFGPSLPWVTDDDVSFVDADGASVRIHDEITLVEPLQLGEDLPAVPVGTRGQVDAFAVLPEGPVWLDLFYSGPLPSTPTFAKPLQLRFSRAREELLEEAKAKREAANHLTVGGVNESEAAFDHEIEDAMSPYDPRAEELARARGMPEDLIEMIKEGLQAVKEGRMRPSSEVFADLTKKYGW